MNDSAFSTLPVSPPIGISAPALLKNNPDESLLLSAWARWRECSQGLQALFDAAPRRGHRPEPTLNERWNAYWDARAPGTPVSRRERAGQLYCSHFESCAQVAFARRTLTAEQLQPLLLILAPPTSVLRLNDEPIHTEQLTLVLSDSGTLKLPAAWVISVGDRQPAAQWLYLPGRPVPIQRFNQRSDMEDWLSGQSLVPQGLPDDDVRVEYTAKAEPSLSESQNCFYTRSTRTPWFSPFLRTLKSPCRTARLKMNHRCSTACSPTFPGPSARLH